MLCDARKKHKRDSVNNCTMIGFLVDKFEQEHIMNTMGLSMSYDGREIANYILDQCEKQNRPVTNLALQKILYFCHVWSLINLNRPLIKHNFEAWQYGPVLQYVYREFKQFDRQQITSRAFRVNPTSGKREVASYNFQEETAALLEQVVNFYSRMSASDLVNMSHADNGPWEKVWNHEGKTKPGMKIDNTEIVEFYSKIVPPYIMQ